MSSGELYSIAHYVACDKFSNVHGHELTAIFKVIRPRSFHKAVRELKWREAMAKEITALEDNNTWSVEPLPPGKTH